MKVGDVVKWSWYLSTDWETTDFLGIIVGSRIVKTDNEKVSVLSVLDNLGSVVDLREDEAGLEVISEC